MKENSVNCYPISLSFKIPGELLRDVKCLLFCSLARTLRTDPIYSINNYISYTHRTY